MEELLQVSKQSADSDISLPPPGDDDCAKKRKNATTSRETKTSSGCAHARRRNPSASADGKATPPSPQQHLEACKPTVLDELPLPGDESKTHDREAKARGNPNQNHQLYLFTPVRQELCCFRGNG
jgi:hypothetical protein